MYAIASREYLFGGGGGGRGGPDTVDLYSGGVTRFGGVRGSGPCPLIRELTFSVFAMLNSDLVFEMGFLSLCYLAYTGLLPKAYRHARKSCTLSSIYHEHTMSLGVCTTCMWLVECHVVPLYSSVYRYSRE